jgi:MFS family permease
MFQPHRRHYLAAFMQDFALTSAFSIIPFYIYEHLGGGAPMSGGIAALQSISYGASCLLVAGYFVQSRFGLQWAGAGTFLFGLFMVLAPMIRHPLWFGAMTVIAVMAQSTFWPMMQSWLGGERNIHARARRMGYYNLSWSLGLATGPLFAGPLYDYDYRLAFVMVLVTAWIAALLVATLPHEDIYFPVAPGSAEPATIMDWKGEGQLYATWVASFTGWAMVGVTRSVFTKRIDELVLADKLMLLWESAGGGVLTLQAATQYSWLAFSLYFTRAGISLVMGHVHGWRHRFWILVAGQWVAAGAFWVMGTTHSLVLMAAACGVVGLNGGISFFASLEYSVANRFNKGRRASIHESMTGLGSALGSITFGYLAGAYGAGWPFRAMPLLIVLPLTLQFILLVYGRRRAQRLAAKISPA